MEFAYFLALGRMVVVGKDTSAVPAKLLCSPVWPVLVPNSKLETYFLSNHIRVLEDIL